jgi:hypothetical protein
MGPQLIAIAPKRELISPLVAHAGRLGIECHCLQWSDRAPTSGLIGRAPRTVLLIVPVLTGRELVTVIDLLDAKPRTSAVVIACAVTDEPDTLGLFSQVLGRTAIIDLRGAGEIGEERFDEIMRQLSSSFWREVAEVVAEHASGMLVLTDDGVIAGAAHPAEASERGPFPAGRPSGARSQIADQSLDGTGRIR